MCHRPRKGEDAVTGTAGFRNGVNIPEEYIYDVNGNMTNDLNKNLPVQYNHLNLVSKYLRMSSDVPWSVCLLSAVVWHTDRNVYSW